MEFLQYAVVIIMVLLPLAGVLIPFVLADPARQSSGLSRAILKIMAILPAAGTLIFVLAVSAMASMGDWLQLPLSWDMKWLSGVDFELHLRFILDEFSLLASAALSMVVLSVQLSGILGVDSVPLPFRFKPSVWATHPVLAKPWQKWGRWVRWAAASNSLLRIPYSRSRVSLQNGLLFASMVLVMGSGLIVSWLGLELATFFTWLLLNSYMQDRAKSSAALRFFLMQRVLSLAILTSCVFVYEVVGGLGGFSANTFMEMIVGAPSASLQVPIQDAFAGAWTGTGAIQHGQVKNILLWAALLATIGVSFTGAMAAMRRSHFMGAGIAAGPLAAVHGAGVGVAALLWLLRSMPVWTGIPPFGPIAIVSGLALAFFAFVHNRNGTDLRQRMAIGTACHLGLMIALVGWGQWETVIQYLIGFMLVTAGVLLSLGRLVSGRKVERDSSESAASLLQPVPRPGVLAAGTVEYYLLAVAAPVNALLPVYALSMAGIEGPSGALAVFLAGLDSTVAIAVQWSAYSLMCFVPLLMGWYTLSTWAIGAWHSLVGGRRRVVISGVEAMTGAEAEAGGASAVIAGLELAHGAGVVVHSPPDQLISDSTCPNSNTATTGESCYRWKHQLRHKTTIIIPCIMVLCSIALVVVGGGHLVIHPAAVAATAMPILGLLLAALVWSSRVRSCRRKAGLVPSGTGGRLVQCVVPGARQVRQRKGKDGTWDAGLPDAGPLESIFILPVYWLADMVINRIFEFLLLESVLFKIPVVVAEFLGKIIRWLTGGKVIRQLIMILLAIGGLIMLVVRQ